jgi:hypothetical protein
MIFIGMRTRKYQLDETYFDTINTEEKAYFLGFLFADGCNILHRNRISIGLNEKDYGLLKQLNDLLFSENCIKTEHRISTHYIKGKRCKSTGRSICLYINSKRISSKLNEIGMIPRKSSVVKFPSCIPPELLCHFVRGYFDGDGSLIKYNSKRGYTIKIASSRTFCLKLKDIVAKHTGINGIVCDESNAYNCFVIGGIYNSKVFCDWMYSSATIKMERKFNRYLELCERVTTLHRAKYKYVYFNKKMGTWIADVYLGKKKMKRLGDRFPTEQAAYDYQQKWLTASRENETSQHVSPFESCVTRESAAVESVETTSSIQLPSSACDPSHC